QLSDNHFQPGWHQHIILLRSTRTLGHNYEEPSPYNLL
ncbi:unnamed protein product, partial [Rotaria sp. Silwood2]